MTHDTIAALEAAGLHAERGALLKREYERRGATYKDGPADWHALNDIETLIGLGGTYQWYEDGELRQMTLTFDPGKECRDVDRRQLEGPHGLAQRGGPERTDRAAIPDRPGLARQALSASAHRACLAAPYEISHTTPRAPRTFARCCCTGN